MDLSPLGFSTSDSDEYMDSLYVKVLTLGLLRQSLVGPFETRRAIRVKAVQASRGPADSSDKLRR